MSRRRRAVAVITTWLIAAGPAVSAPREISTLEIVEALQQGLCFESVWGAPSARLGRTIIASVSRQGDDAYIWTEGLDSRPGAKRIATFYAISRRDGVAYASEKDAWNLRFSWTGNAFYESKRRLVFDTGAQAITMTLSPRCDHRVASTSPLKTAMLRDVDRALGRYAGQERSRKTLEEFILADFNTRDPYTYAIRSETGEVLHIRLHDAAPGAAFRYAVVSATDIPERQYRRTIRERGLFRRVSVASQSPPGNR
jgi:hypothetical protein